MCGGGAWPSRGGCPRRTNGTGTTRGHKALGDEDDVETRLQKGKPPYSPTHRNLIEGVSPSVAIITGP